MAFYSCLSLENISLGENVEVIGESAFYNCKLLSAVSVTKKLNFVKKNAFYGCVSLDTVEYDGTSGKRKTVVIADGNGYFKDIFRGTSK